MIDHCFASLVGFESTGSCVTWLPLAFGVAGRGVARASGAAGFGGAAGGGGGGAGGAWPDDTAGANKGPRRVTDPGIRPEVTLGRHHGEKPSHPHKPLASVRGQ